MRANSDYLNNFVLTDDFKKYQDYDFYVSKEGEIIGEENGKFYEIKPYLNKSNNWKHYNWSKGYYKFRYKGKMFNLHRVLAELFVPGWFRGAVVDHIDNDSTNNDISNLQWITWSENTRKMLRNETEEQKTLRYQHMSEAVKKGHAEGKYDQHFEKMGWKHSQNK